MTRDVLFAATLTQIKAALGLAIVLLFGAGVTAGRATAQVVDPFIPVLIDKKTEAALGAFPYDRAVLAAAVERSVQLGAKGVVLKFFFVDPRSDIGDRALARSMRKTKVLLQGGNIGAPGPNALPDRFKMNLAVAGKTRALVTGAGGNPLAQFSAEAYDIGFVDLASSDRVPIIESYGDKYVKALVTASLELAFDEPVRVTPGKSASLGTKTLVLDDLSQASISFPEHDTLQYIPLVDFLGHSPRPEVRGRVVIIGFDGETFQPLHTPIGPVRPHRVFCYELLSLYHQLEAARP